MLMPVYNGDHQILPNMRRVVFQDEEKYISIIKGEFLPPVGTIEAYDGDRTYKFRNNKELNKFLTDYFGKEVFGVLL